MQDRKTQTENSGLRIPFVTIITLLLGMVALVQAGGDSAQTIISLSVMTVVLIVFGERFALDEALEKRGIPGREAWLSVIALAVALLTGAVSPDTVPRVIGEKIDIIAFILSFAIISEGIAKSGYFSFAAYKIVQKCQGNTTRLILYLFVLTSILTFVTSNDIVVLVLTPIIIAVCVHARITNMRLLLLSQFVAANTLSMGLLIGSPTNIIVSSEMGISFVEYFLLMFVPSIIAFMLTFIVVDWINQHSRPGDRNKGYFRTRWKYVPTYFVPGFARFSHFTDSMRNWLWLFTAGVVLLAIVSGMDQSLLWAAIPISLGSIIYLYREVKRETTSSTEGTKEVLHLLHYLPYGIFFFGMCFFIFADELVRLQYVETTVIPFIQQHLLGDLVTASVSITMLSGLLVNSINDLPAAALISELLTQLETVTPGGLDEYVRLMVLQGMLVGLNIGCYVTPIGALAGLLWFNIIRREERRHREQLNATLGGSAAEPLATKSEMPERGDLVLYGLINFVFVGLMVGLMLPFLAQVLDIFVSSPDVMLDSPVNERIALRAYLPVIGVSILLFTIMRFRAILRANRVFLGHMREVFVILTRVTVWSMKHRTAYYSLLGLLVVVGAGTMLYWSEMMHNDIYAGKRGLEPLFGSFGTFMVWLLKFTGSGLSDELMPRSTLGMALTGLLPMIAIGAIIIVSRLTTEQGVSHLARRLARGDIPGYRAIIINHHSGFEKFVDEILKTRDTSVLLLCSPSQIDRAQSFASSHNLDSDVAHRIYATLKSGDTYHDFHEYRMDEADEIYLLTDMTVEGEYEKLRYLTKLDEAISRTKLSEIEGNELGIDRFTVEDGGSAHSDHAHFFGGIPKIVVESASERYADLVKRSSSQFMLKNMIRVTFDREVCAFITADLDETLFSLNRLYHFGRKPENDRIFNGGKSPEEDQLLVSYPLDTAGKEVFWQFFGGAITDIGEMDHRDLVRFSIKVRAEIQESAKQAKYIKNKKKEAIKPEDFFGVMVKIADSHYHFGVPSAALSMQAASAERVILRQPVGTKTRIPRKAVIPKNMRIFVFNLNPHSKAFIRSLMAIADEMEDGRPELYVLYHGRRSVPEDIKQHAITRLVYGETVEDILKIVCPVVTEPHEKSFLVKSGDRIYVFNDYDHAADPELSSIDFLDRLDTRIRKIMAKAGDTDQPARVNHRDLYIAVEVHGREGRFLFENFFVDKIMDSAQTRTSYLGTLAKIYHRALSDGELLGYRHGSFADFGRAAEIARYLSHYVVEYADDIVLRDMHGADMKVVGKSFDQAIIDIQAYSNPPVQLFSRVRVKVARGDDAASHNRAPGLYVEVVPENEPVAPDDLLICLPLI